MSANHSMGESNLLSRRVTILVLSLFFSVSYIVSSFSLSRPPHLCSCPLLYCQSFWRLYCLCIFICMAQNKRCGSKSWSTQRITGLISTRSITNLRGNPSQRLDGTDGQPGLCALIHEQTRSGCLDRVKLCVYLYLQIEISMIGARAPVRLEAPTWLMNQKQAG